MPSPNPAVNQATHLLNVHLSLIQLGKKTVDDLRALLQTPIAKGVSWADAINNDLWGIQSDSRLRGAPMVQALIDEAHAAQTLPLLMGAGGDIAAPLHHDVALATRHGVDELVSAAKLLGAVGGDQVVKALLDAGVSPFQSVGVEPVPVIANVRFWWDMLLAGRDDTKQRKAYQFLHEAAMRKQGIKAGFVDRAAQLITGMRWGNVDDRGRLEFNYYFGPSPLCPGEALWHGAIAGNYPPAKSTEAPIQAAISQIGRWFPTQVHRMVTDPSQANVIIQRADIYNPAAPPNQQSTMGVRSIQRGDEMALGCVAVDLYSIAIHPSMPGAVALYAQDRAPIAGIPGLKDTVRVIAPAGLQRSFEHELLHLQGLMHPLPQERPHDVTTLMHHADTAYPGNQRPGEPSARDCRALELLYGKPQCAFSVAAADVAKVVHQPSPVSFPTLVATTGVPGCDSGLFPTGTMPLSAQCDGALGYGKPSLWEMPAQPARSTLIGDVAKAGTMGFVLGATDRGIERTMQRFSLKGRPVTATKAMARAGLVYCMSGGASAMCSLGGDVLSSMTAGTAYEGAVRHVTTGVSVVVALATDGVSGLGNLALCFMVGAGSNALGTAAVDGVEHFFMPD